MIYKGRAHKFGTDINTDDIIAAKYLNTTDKLELASHCMEHVDKDFMKKIKPGDRKNMVFAGTSISYGRAVALVVATGMQTD